MEHLNEVRLVGRVAAAPETRSLPSGDELALVRVVVDRAGGGEGPRRVDTIDVACWAGRPRAVAARLQADDVVEVAGALRRRFFRAGGGVASRYEVEATRLVRRSR